MDFASQSGGGAQTDPGAARDRRAALVGLRERARRERRLCSPPLLAAGLLVGAFGPVAADGDATASALYWLLGGPLVLLALRRWYAGHADRLGIGSDARPYARSAVGVGLLLLWGPLNLLVPAAALGVGLAAIAIRQANRRLLWWAVGVAGYGVLAGVDLVGNRVYDVVHLLHPGSSGYVGWAPDLVYGLAGAALLAGAIHARVSERA